MEQNKLDSIEIISECIKIISIDLKEILAEIKHKNIEYSIINKLFKKLGLSKKSKETQCLDGVFTPLDSDIIFIKTIEESLTNRFIRLLELLSNNIQEALLILQKNKNDLV